MKVPRFLSEEHLKKWLCESPAGQAIVNDVVADVDPKRPLLLCVADTTHVELYSDCRHKVHYATKVTPQYPSHEALCDQLLDADLTAVWSTIYEPRNKIGEVMPERLTLAEYEWRQAYAANLSDFAELTPLSD